MVDQSKKTLKKRLTIYIGVLIVIFVSLTSKLFYLQVVSANDYKKLSDDNRIRIVAREARRGDILDVNNNVLASSKPVFSILLTNMKLENQDEIIKNLVDVINMPDITEEVIKEKMEEHFRYYEPVEIIRLPWSPETIETITKIEEKRSELPGIMIQEVPLRYYSHGNIAGHILGYVGAINKDELEKNKEYGYSMNDLIGKRGIEKTAEVFEHGDNPIGLKGKKGVTQMEVNVHNRPVRKLVDIPPTPGQNVKLTIDLDVQEAMEKSLDDVILETKKSNSKAGAGGAVVLDVKTGAIIAMASKPDINPNDFVDGTYQEKLDYYHNTTPGPWWNRVLQEEYPPGSTFKLITGMAFLESGASPSYKVNCIGRYWKPPYIRCSTGTHGKIDVKRALAVSCNTYFQYAAEAAGIEMVNKIGKEFGLGEKTGARDIDRESSGLMPTPEWKKKIGDITIKRQYDKKRKNLQEKYDKLKSKAKITEERDKLQKDYDRELAKLEAQYKIDYNFATKWHPFDTYNTSIGQGSNQYTVLQLANVVSTIANNGNRMRPYLIDQVVAPDGKVVKEYKPELVKKVDVSKETLDAVVEGMKAVTAPRGTAYFLFSNFPKDIRVAAKTGTAQTGRSGDSSKSDFHGVFVAFAPADDPEIAFAGVVEYGRSGGGSAGHVAKACFEAYFGLNKD